MSSGSGGGSGGEKNSHIPKLVPEYMKKSVSRLKELFIGEDFSDEVICSALQDSNMNLDDAATRLADLGYGNTEMVSITGSNKMKEPYLGSVGMIASTKMKEPYLVRGSLFKVPEIMVKKVANQLREAFGLIVSDEQICSTLKECNMSAEDAASKLAFVDLGSDGLNTSDVDVMKKAPNAAAKKDEKAVNTVQSSGTKIENLAGSDGLNTSDVDVGKKAPNAAAKKDEKAVNTVQSSGTKIENLAGGARAKWSEMPEDEKKKIKKEKKEMEKKKKQIKMVIEKADGNDILKALEASNMDVEEALKKLRSAGFDEKAPGPAYPLYVCPNHKFEANVYQRFKINCYQLVFMWHPDGTLTLHGLWPAWRSRTIHETTGEERIKVESVQFARGNVTEEGKRDWADKLAAKAGEFPNFESYSVDVVNKLRGELDKIWIGKENDGETFWLREWGAHGIFAGMKCETYFKTSLRLANIHLEGLQNAFRREIRGNECIQVTSVENNLKSKLGHKPFLHITMKGGKPILDDIILLFDLDLEIIDHDGVRKFEECHLNP